MDAVSELFREKSNRIERFRHVSFHRSVLEALDDDRFSHVLNKTVGKCHLDARSVEYVGGFYEWSIIAPATLATTARPAQSDKLSVAARRVAVRVAREPSPVLKRTAPHIPVTEHRLSFFLTFSDATNLCAGAFLLSNAAVEPPEFAVAPVSDTFMFQIRTTKEQKYTARRCLNDWSCHECL